MTPAEFMNTNLFGALFSLFSLLAVVYMAFQAGKAGAYTQGWKAGRQNNPKPEVLVITEYVYDNQRIVRFDPRTPDVFILLDLKKGTIARIPYNIKMEAELLEETKEH